MRNYQKLIYKNNILDLRVNGDLDPDSAKLFNKISISIRNDYNSLISELSEPNKDNIFWWTNEISTRNTFVGPFFHYFCSVHFVIELIKQPNFKFQKIIVDTKSFKNIIESIVKKNNIVDCIVVINSSLKNKLKKFLKRQIGDFYFFLYNFLKLIIAKILFKRSKIKNEDLVLIDIFVIPGYTNSKRWYGSFWDNLSDSRKDEIFFVSTIIQCSIFNLASIFFQLRKSSENYIIKEQYLGFKDLIFASRYRKKFKQFKINNIIICDQNFSILIKECILYPTDICTIQESLLTYKFVERLKEKNIRVRLAIDWFEGHSLDKAWNAAFKNYYPLTKTIGYRAFESFPLYLCSYPIPIEAKAGVLPDAFAVQGLKTSHSIKEFMPKLDTILIPAFKADYVWNDYKRSKKSFLDQILVALPISIEISKSIISMIIAIAIEEENKKYNFVVKPHPTMSDNSKFNKLLQNLPKNVKFTSEKSFSNLLYESNVLITEASSTCLESISMGVPVIIIRTKKGFFFNPIPVGLNKKLYRFCDSKEDIMQSINLYFSLDNLNRDELTLESQKIRANYFEPITQEGINRFLNFNNQKGGSYS